MFKTRFFSILALLLLFTLASLPAQAQKSKSKRSSGVAEYLDDKGNFASHLWYGGNFNLGFNGTSYYNLFNIGISPMVGYRVLEPLSFGPRVTFQYTYLKGTCSDGRVRKTQPLSYGAGVFSRVKFLRNFFVHAEYEYESAEYPLADPFSGYFAFDPDKDRILTQRENRDNVFIGAGYNSSSGRGFGTEILLLYNVLGSELLELPFDFRFGLTYNF